MTRPDRARDHDPAPPPVPAGTPPGGEPDEFVLLADELDRLRSNLDVAGDPPAATTAGLTPPNRLPGTAPVPDDVAAELPYDHRWLPPQPAEPAHDDCLTCPSTRPGVDPPDGPHAARAGLVAAVAEQAAAAVLSERAAAAWRELLDRFDVVAGAATGPAPGPPGGDGDVEADRALAVAVAQAAVPEARHRAAVTHHLSRRAGDHVARCRELVTQTVAVHDEQAPPRLSATAHRRRDRVVDALYVAGPVLDTGLLLEIVAAYQGVERSGNQISWLIRADARSGAVPQLRRAVDAAGNEVPGTWFLDHHEPLVADLWSRHWEGPAGDRNRRRTAASLAADALDLGNHPARDDELGTLVRDPERLRSLAVRTASDVLGVEPPDVHDRTSTTVWLAAAWWHLAASATSPPHAPGRSPPA